MVMLFGIVCLIILTVGSIAANKYAMKKFDDKMNEWIDRMNR